MGVYRRVLEMDAVNRWVTVTGWGVLSKICTYIEELYEIPLWNSDR
jgi:hypothetical protein